MQNLSPLQLDNLLARLATVDDVDRWEAARLKVATNPLAGRAVQRRAREARDRVRATPPPPRAPEPAPEPAPSPPPPTTDRERQWLSAAATCGTMEDLLDVLARMTKDGDARYPALTVADLIRATGDPQHRRELRRLRSEALQLDADLLTLGFKD